MGVTNKVLAVKFPVNTNRATVLEYVTMCNSKTLYFSGINVFIKLENGDWLDRFPRSKPYNTHDIATLIGVQGGWMFLT